MATVTWIAVVAGTASTGTNWDNGTGISAADTVVFDGVVGNANCNWDITTSIASINTTGYSGVVTPSVTMTVAGNITFANSTFAHGNQILKITNTCSLNVGNNSLYKLTFDGNFTTTITGTVTVVNTLDLNASNNATINGGTIEAQGDVQNTGTNSVVGTTALNFTGGANQTFSYATASNLYGLKLPITINKSANTLTLSGVIGFNANWTYVAGTVAAGTSEIRLQHISGQDITWNDSTTQFYKFSNSLAITVTLSADLHVTNNFDFSISAVDVNSVWNGNKIYIGGNLSTGSISGASQTGTSVIELNGTGTWSQGHTNTDYRLALDVIVNTAGTLTVSGTVHHGGNFTYTAGTVTTTSSTYKKMGTKNLNSGTLSWNNVTFSTTFAGNGTTTLTGNLAVAGTLTINASQTLSAGSNTITAAGNWTNNGTFTAGTSTVTFNGTSTLAGATTFNNFTINNTKTVHLTSTQTFTVSGAFTTSGTSTLDATTGGSRANLSVNGSQSVTGVTATDIDSSGGSVKPIINTGGTNTNTVQWDTAAAASTKIIKMMLMGIG